MKNSKLSLLVLCLGLAACNGIPSAYVGKYIDAATGLQVEVGSSSVTMTKRGQRAVRLSAKELKSDTLLKIQAGAYYAPGATDNDPVDVYVITPVAGSNYQDGDLVWFDAELALGTMDPTVKDKVPNLVFEYCQRGSVLIDVATKAVQLGCPGESTLLNLVRSGKQR